MPRGGDPIANLGAVIVLKVNAVARLFNLQAIFKVDLIELQIIFNFCLNVGRFNRK